MAIRWDPPDIDEIKESLEDTSNLTLCSTYFIPTRNTLLITVAVTFPDYAQLENGKEIYFADVNNRIYLSLTPITAAKLYTRSVQQFRQTETCKYFRIPVPVQIRKAYKLDQYRNVHLIKQGDKYECIFI